MSFLVEDALRLWKDIPSERLTEAVEAAIIHAGNFPATTGLVAKCWADRRPKESLADFHNITGQMRALPPPQSHEALEALGDMAREIQRLLGPGTRPKGWTP